MIEAVVFDLDGVIVDSEPVWERVRRALVADHGGTWAEDTQHRLMGMSTAEWSEYLSGELGVRLTASEVARLVIERMSAAYAQRLPLLPGAVDAVRRMRERWRLGVASSSPAVLIETVLRTAKIDSLFDIALSSERVERGKPAPDVYLAAAARLGVEPAHCVAVEDSSNGLRSASAAGMRVIAVPHPRYPPAPDALALASTVLDGLAELTVGIVTELDR